MAKTRESRSLSERDQNFIWHPFTQVQIESPPIPIKRSQDACLFAEDGTRLIDAISSWWVNIHGHNHPKVAERVKGAVGRLDQIIFAGFTHEPAVELSQKLLERLPPNQKKIFYSDDGSTAVEAGIKMAIQYWLNRGEDRPVIAALNDGYHGDTFGAMAAGGRGVFTAPFADKLFEVKRVDISRPKESLQSLAAVLNERKAACIIYEPLVQGAGGMLMHSEENLELVLSEFRKSGALLIADEVMTGFGRTGKFFASDHLSIKPDIFCLSKGLTNGFLPLGVTSATQEIFDAFLSESRGKMFLHSHSFTANPLSCAAALGSLEVFESENVFERVEAINKAHNDFASELKAHPLVKNIRIRGTILAFDVEAKEETGYLNSLRDRMYAAALSKGVILRPLGNVLYVMPPYCISRDELREVYGAVFQILDELP